jgi:hypothetical protein
MQMRAFDVLTGGNVTSSADASYDDSNAIEVTGKVSNESDEESEISDLSSDNDK